MFFLHDGSCTKWQSNRHLERGHCFTNWVMDTKNVYNIKVSRYWRTHGNFSIFDRSSEKSVPLSVVPLHTHGWFGSWVQVMSLVTIETSINMQASEKNIFLLSKQNWCKFISKSYFFVSSQRAIEIMTLINIKQLNVAWPSHNCYIIRFS